MDYPQFPNDFRFGTATAAFQIEGGWNDDGKGLSTWDTFTHKPGRIKTGETAEIACNTYRDYQTDIDLMAKLGLKAYRFSIAWSRVLPQGTGLVNAKGLDYYDQMVDALLAKGIAPFVTLFHWDMPQALEDAMGGFAGRDCAYHFADYAEVAVKRLGDRVKHWITQNARFLGRAIPAAASGEGAPGASLGMTPFDSDIVKDTPHGRTQYPCDSRRRSRHIRHESRVNYHIRPCAGLGIATHPASSHA